MSWFIIIVLAYYIAMIPISYCIFDTIHDKKFKDGWILVSVVKCFLWPIFLPSETLTYIEDSKYCFKEEDYE